MTSENPQRRKYESISHGFGITGLILGIVTLLVSFIPCFGVFAFIFGIIAILISIIGLVVAMKHDHSKGLIIGALLTSLLGCGIAYSQYAAMQGITEESIDFGNEFFKSMDEESESKNINNEKDSKEIYEPNDDSPSDESYYETEENVSEKEISANKFLKITVDNLRVRTKPNLDADKIENLLVNSEVEYLNEKSNLKTIVLINGAEINDYWYKIKTSTGNIGWIHGCCFVIQ